MGKSKKARGYWTKDRLKKEAKKYNSRSQFAKQSFSAYSIAQRKGYLNECCVHMKRLKKADGYWTKQRVLSESKKYKTKTEFRKGCSSAYNVARNQGFLDECFENMLMLVKPKGTWTKKALIEEAKKYKTRSAFKKANYAAYATAQKKGYLDECSKHMRRQGSRYKRFIYAIEFSDRSVYVGLTYNYNERIAAHNKRSSNKFVQRKIKEGVGHKFVLQGKLLDKESAAQEEAKLIKQYRRSKWDVLNIQSAGGLGGFQKTKWTKGKVMEEAKRYRTRTEFKRGSHTAWKTARKEGYLDSCCRHMETKQRKSGFWNNKENVLAAARECKTRAEFSSKYGAARNSAKKHGWLNECQQHMKHQLNERGFWKNKVNVLKAAKRCQTRAQFKREESGAWSSAQRYGWLDECHEHMTHQTKKRGFWRDKANVLEAAKQCKTRTEFTRKYGAARNSAKKHGWLDKCHQLIDAQCKQGSES